MRSGYEAALQGLALADGGSRAWLEMRGPDSADFLQRVLSSDLRRLAAGGGQWSALLDGHGHWIADLLLFRLGAAADEVFGLDVDATLLTTLAQRLDMLRFGERLSWGDPAAQPARLLLLGPEAAAALSARGLPAPPDREGFGIVRHGAHLLLRRPDRGAPCVELLGSRAELASLEQDFLTAGAARADAEALETLRIEAFIPRHGADFDAETTLPVSGEWRRASVTKGCYSGQEVVARINTYGEAPRQLCRLHFEDGADMRGAELMDETGRSSGTVSSWALSPRLGHGVGLGTLRRRAAVNGAQLTAVREAGRSRVRVEVPVKQLG